MIAKMKKIEISQSAFELLESVTRRWDAGRTDAQTKIVIDFGRFRAKYTTLERFDLSAIFAVIVT